jgi:hypothetical protein
MKNTMPNRYQNKHVAALTKTEKEILVIYDHIKMAGNISSAGLVNEQIEILKRQTNSGSDIKYLFTCC